jgi:hypothetical protein
MPGRQIQHGHNTRAHATPIYSIWASMKQRCYDPHSKSYPRYGGRGIIVCDRWRNSFGDFLADMGDRPSPDYSLERKDNTGPYSPENCRWATRKEQCRNRRSSRLITHDGQTRPSVEWSELTGVNRATIERRIDHYGWSVSRALTTPAGPSGPKKKHSLPTE